MKYLVTVSVVVEVDHINSFEAAKLANDAVQVAKIGGGGFFEGLYAPYEAKPYSKAIRKTKVARAKRGGKG